MGSKQDGKQQTDPHGSHGQVAGGLVLLVKKFIVTLAIGIDTRNQCVQMGLGCIKKCPDRIQNKAPGFLQVVGTQCGNRRSQAFFHKRLSALGVQLGRLRHFGRHADLCKRFPQITDGCNIAFDLCGVLGNPLGCRVEQGVADHQAVARHEEIDLVDPVGLMHVFLIHHFHGLFAILQAQHPECANPDQQGQQHTIRMDSREPIFMSESFIFCPTNMHLPIG
jgi:hypothetical protein